MRQRVIVEQAWRQVLDALHDQVALGGMQGATGRAGLLHHVEVVRRVQLAACAERARQQPRQHRQWQRDGRIEIAARGGRIQQIVELVAFRRRQGDAVRRRDTSDDR